MGALGLYREVMHEKLCDPKLRWANNDLTDMMYLTAAAAPHSHTSGKAFDASEGQRTPTLN